MPDSNYAVLRVFRSLFEGQPYLHRDSSLGDRVASYIYEDLYSLNKSTRLRDRIDARSRVLNAQNLTVGVPRRRGDGTFGERVPVAPAITDVGFAVARGPVATIEIGVETKILAKAMIKQIDRVISDLIRQTEEFKKSGGRAICVGIVGVISLSNTLLTKVIEVSRPTGKNTKILSRRRRMQFPDSVNALHQVLMSFWLLGSMLPIHRRIRFRGSTKAKRSFGVFRGVGSALA